MDLMNLPKDAYDPAKEVADKMDAIIEGAKEALSKLSQNK